MTEARSPRSATMTDWRALLLDVLLLAVATVVGVWLMWVVTG